MYQFPHLSKFRRRSKPLHLGMLRDNCGVVSRAFNLYSEYRLRLHLMPCCSSESRRVEGRCHLPEHHRPDPDRPLPNAHPDYDARDRQVSESDT